jgi:carboxymethylenebutenolidase
MSAQTTSSAQNVSARQVDIPTAQGAIDSWLFHPANGDAVSSQPATDGRWPLVILNTDIKGVRPTFVEHGRKLAAAGFFVVLPNLYHRIGRAPVIDPGAVFGDEKSKERLAQLRQSLSNEGIHADHQAIFDYVATQDVADSRRIGIVGYCLSGAISLRIAADFPNRIKAAASFHGGRLASDAADSPHLRAAEIKAQLYLGYARDDASMTDAQIATLEQALKAANVGFSSDLYAAKHGFAVADSASYDAAAATLHWQRTVALFRSTLA